MKLHYVYVEYGSKASALPATHAKLQRLAEARGLEPVFYDYDAIIEEISAVDPELGRLAGMVNTCLPALIADIGRICVLYRHGGIYCDVKFTITQGTVTRIKERLDEFGYCFWIHPSKRILRCRNTCMAAVAGQLDFLHVVGSMKRTLLRWLGLQRKHAGARFNVFTIGYKFSEVLTRNKHPVRRPLKGDEPYCEWGVRGVMGWNRNPPGYKHWSIAQKTMPVFVLEDTNEINSLKV